MITEPHVGQEIRIVTPQDTLPARITKIEQALAAVSTPEQAKQVIAIADAAIAYAKSLGQEFVEARKKAEALKLDAERRLGEFLRTMPKAIGVRGQLAGRDSSGGTKVEPPEKAASLADLGIDKKTSARVQKLAGLPDETVEAIKAGELTVSQAIGAKKPEPKPDRTAELESLVVELREQLRDLGDEAADLRALADGEGAKQVAMIRAELKAACATRDQLMRENSELKRQVKSYARRLGIKL